jgi:hypothetical protein
MTRLSPLEKASTVGIGSTNLWLDSATRVLGMINGFRIPKSSLLVPHRSIPSQMHSFSLSAAALSPCRNTTEFNLARRHLIVVVARRYDMLALNPSSLLEKMSVKK